MPRFNGKFTRTFTTRATVEQTTAFLSDPRTWVLHQDEIETSSDLGNGSLDVVLKEHSHGPAKFQARYRCTWQRTASGARWDSADGANFELHGHVQVRPKGSGAEVTWTESVGADVPVPRLMVRVVRPIAESLMARGLARFADKMNTELDRLAG